MLPLLQGHDLHQPNQFPIFFSTKRIEPTMNSHRTIAAASPGIKQKQQHRTKISKQFSLMVRGTSHQEVHDTKSHNSLQGHFALNTASDHYGESCQ